jgi:hypothetical protein
MKSLVNSWRTIAVVSVLAILSACGGGGGGGDTPPAPPPPTAPTITTQPQSSTVVAGANATFNVTANGTAPLSYQWRRNGTDIVGATSATLTFASAAADNGVAYAVVVSNGGGSITSANATLTVNVPPTITSQPQPSSVADGASASFSVTATGTAPLSFQWRRNGIDIGGATAATLNLGTVTLADNAAVFSVVVANVVGSIPSSGATLTVNPTISGAVTDGLGAALNNIQILLRRNSDKLTQATTRTDAAGHYSLQPPVGDYIIAAVNDGTASFAASEWWTSTGGSGVFNSAEKFTLGATSVTRNFALDPGARIQGTITGGSGPLAGIQVRPREPFNNSLHLDGITDASGHYVTHVAPGTYVIAALNTTDQPFAMQWYNPLITNGGTDAGFAQKQTLLAGNTLTADMNLIAGHKVSGTVTDPVTGPVPGMLVILVDAPQVFVENTRTRADGTYVAWLAPAMNYRVQVRGQAANSIDLSAVDQVRDFGAAVAAFTATMRDASNGPVSNVKGRLRQTGVTNNIGTEVSDADGSLAVYRVAGSSPGSDSLFELLLENNPTVSSSIYLDQTRLLSGTVLTATTPGTTALGTIHLLAGARLQGTVTTTTAVPRNNAFVQVRLNGTDNNDRFVVVPTGDDGAYSVSLPANVTVARVCAFTTATGAVCPAGPPTPTGSSAGLWQYFDNIPMLGAGTVTTQDFSY